jgi:hypothetical protein
MAFSVSAQRLLVRNEAFASQLAPEDLAALYKAHGDERRVTDLLIEFYKSYDAAAGIVTAYGKVSGAAAADSLHTRFEAVKDSSRMHAEALAQLWERVFDNKTFAYNYLLDVGGRRALLSQMEAAGTAAGEAIARRRESEESEHVLEYLEQKSLMFTYEHTMAEVLGARGAADSLRDAQTLFDLLKRPLPKLELEERNFIEYQPIKIFSPARYNAANPIPQVEEYSKGAVYRVRLGSYSARQSVGVFRGVWPLGYKQNGKMWEYYAGGYDNLAEGEKALTDMKRRGFTKAVLVVWSDGVASVVD